MNSDEVELIRLYWKRMMYFNKHKEGRYMMFVTRLCNMKFNLKELLKELRSPDIKERIKRYKEAGFK